MRWGKREREKEESACSDAARTAGTWLWFTSQQRFGPNPHDTAERRQTLGMVWENRTVWQYRDTLSIVSAHVLKELLKEKTLTEFQTLTAGAQFSYRKKTWPMDDWNIGDAMGGILLDRRLAILWHQIQFERLVSHYRQLDCWGIYATAGGQLWSHCNYVIIRLAL